MNQQRFFGLNNSPESENRAAAKRPGRVIFGTYYGDRPLQTRSVEKGWPDKLVALRPSRRSPSLLHEVREGPRSALVRGDWQQATPEHGGYSSGILWIPYMP
jgi:hypothetical protein